MGRVLPNQRFGKWGSSHISWADSILMDVKVSALGLLICVKPIKWEESQTIKTTSELIIF